VIGGSSSEEYFSDSDVFIQKKFVSLETELENALDEPRFSRLVYHDAAWYVPNPHLSTLRWHFALSAAL